MATFAQRAQAIINQYDMRPGDSASENAKNAELRRLKEAQEIAYATVKAFVKSHPTAFDRIVFVYYAISDENKLIIQETWKEQMA